MDEQPQEDQPTTPPPADVQYANELDNFAYPPKPKHTGRKVFAVILTLILLAALGGGVYYFMNKQNSTKPTTVTTTTSGANKSQTGSNGTAGTTKDTSITSIDSTTAHYDSTNFSLGFDYPKDWVVSDTGSGSLTVTSPPLQFEDATNQNVTGEIIMTIQNKQTTVPAFASGNAVAAIDSEKITYKSPTQNQRAATYVTFANYTGGTKGINALYVTGDNGYQLAQAIPQADIVQDDPLINVSFFSCSDTTCKTPANKLTASAIAATSWSSDPGLSKPLLSMLESLAIN